MDRETMVSVATTVAERKRLVEEWTWSGLTQRAFGRLHNVSVSSLNRWVLAIRRGVPMIPRGERAASASRAALGTIEFRDVSPAAAAETGSAGVRIALPSGVELDIPVGTDVAYVQALVNALGGPC